MNEIILAYGLGIVSVGLFVLTRVILKADKKVSEHERWMREFERGQEDDLESVSRRMDESEQIVAREFDEVNRRIDSRIDKLESKMKDQLNFIKNKTSQEY